MLKVDAPLKVRGVHADFRGVEETKATYTTMSSTGKTTTITTHTAVQHVTIARNEKLLAGRPRAGFFANLFDALATLVGGGRHKVMPPGEYEHVMDVSIPETAPPTHQGDRSRVFYELSVRFDVPFRRDIRQTHSFDVTCLPQDVAPKPVRVRYPEDGGRGLADRMFGPEVQVELALAHDVLAPGDTVEGTFQIETEKPLEIRAIRARLVGQESSEAQGHHDSHTHRGDAVTVATPGTIQGTFTERFMLRAESVRDMPVTSRGSLFSINWFVEIQLDVPWAKDPTIRAPVVLTPRTNDAV